ncbi:phosphoribosylanthranilate isomerase [Paenibacillus shirakamiensis]|uniref:N-(5'-phosphoribosyl)anthranilate isomerase n=1 Tax=Paenibacillus shirakamiensis TaxID=1265935 RepID=A0ABS4JCW0_9BACL|nr:phosphoribosylanthranilate isomerase [Paenibacillus shirakamiensis]MBP1999549.1 phosphoribosylanthranilate isomerase [Paenibacillus shirakamiensis]
MSLQTTVKICGLQSVEVLKSMINLPVDHIGLVFAPSKRKITAQTAALLIEVLNQWTTQSRPRSVGVFVNPSLNELREVLVVAKLDIIQLHGQESPEFCQQIRSEFNIEVYKACSIHSQGLNVGYELESYRGTIDGMLLDTYDPLYGGGSGETFDWTRIESVQKWTNQVGIPLIIAGGLHPDNVQDLLYAYHPDGVDVSSGVETDGLKDVIKIMAFVERVKN